MKATLDFDPTFDTWQEYEDWFYSFNDCLSDDVDQEQGRLERFAEDNDVVIKEKS